MIRTFAFGLTILTCAAVSVHSLTAQAQSREETRLRRVTYPIADLTASRADASALQPPPPAGAQKRDVAAEILVRHLISTVSKNTWEDFGGPGSIQFFPKGQSLVINQTPEIHEEIQSLLAKMRRSRAIQVAVDVRFLEVPPATARRLLNVMKKYPQSGNESPVTVDENRLQAILGIVQGARFSNIRQVPRITLDNGQKGGVSVVSDGFGQRFDVSSVVGADRKNVKLWLDVEDAVAKTRSLRAADTFNVPSGRTLIWHVGEIGGTHVFVTATPQIVVAQEEEERIFLGERPPIPGR